MRSKFFPPTFASKTSEGHYLHLTKNYDVYRSDQISKIVVHRNVIIRGAKSICSTGNSFDFPQLLELKQPNGQTVFVSLAHVVMVCEHGTDVSIEAFRPA
jgi:hypothetical protein